MAFDTERLTALVTGASSGIGVDFSRELAGRGYNLVLAARRRERLDDLQQKLQQEFGVEVTVVVCDLSDAAGAQNLFAAIQDSGFKIDLLVNNAGLGVYGNFVDQSLDQVQEMIQVNLNALTALTHLFATSMQLNGGGKILNHASFSGIQPVPKYAVYSATKAYVLALSQAANHELNGTGVSISALCPGFFRSEFFDKSGQSPGRLVRSMLLESEAVARAGINGALARQTVIIPGFNYKFLNVLIRCFPRSWRIAVSSWFCAA